MRNLKISKSITSREDQSVDRYLQEIWALDLIDLDEEIELARRIQTWDAHALERLVESNLRFVVSVAKQYQNQWLSLPDLINEGNYGLIKAAQRFDHTRWFKFISYAVWWIRQSILAAITENKTIRIPANQETTSKKIKKTRSQLEQILGREPSYQEIADQLHLPEEKIQENMSIVSDIQSLDSPVNSAFETISLGESVASDIDPTDYYTHSEDTKIEINKILSIIWPKEKIILEYYYGINYKPEHTLDEIGSMLWLTRERVRQIKEKTEKKLKKYVKNNNIDISFFL